MGKFSKSQPQKQRHLVKRHKIGSQRNIIEYYSQIDSFQNQIPKESNNIRSLYNSFVIKKQKIRKKKRQGYQKNISLNNVKKEQMPNNLKKQQKSQKYRISENLNFQNIVKEQINEERDIYVSLHNQSQDDIVQVKQDNIINQNLIINIERMINERVSNSMLKYVDRMNQIQNRLRAVQKWFNLAQSQQDQEDKFQVVSSHPIKQQQLQRLKYQQQRIKLQNEIKLETQIKAQISKSQEIQSIDQLEYLEVNSDC